MNDIKIFAINERELDTLTLIISIYSQAIGTEFGIDRCALLTRKSGKKETTVWIQQLTAQLAGTVEYSDYTSASPMSVL